MHSTLISHLVPTYKFNILKTKSLQRTFVVPSSNMDTIFWMIFQTSDSLHMLSSSFEYFEQA